MPLLQSAPVILSIRKYRLAGFEAYVPAAACEQLAAPSELVKLPFRHGEHVVDDVPKKPVGHVA